MISSSGQFVKMLGRFSELVSDLIRDFVRKNCPAAAAALAYYTLFSLFPLSLLVISIAGFVVGPSIDKEELAAKIAAVIPISTDFLVETMQGVVEARAITGIVSLVGIVWASTAALATLRKGINTAWGIPVSRPFLRERLLEFGLTLGAGLLLVALLFVTPTIGLFLEIAEYVIPKAQASVATWNMIAQVMNSAISFISFVVLYRFVPNTELRLRDIWRGALIASTVFEAVKWGFVFYIRSYSVYNVIYGSIGAMMALMAWVYLSAVIILFGALITSRFARFSAKARQAESNTSQRTVSPP